MKKGIQIVLALVILGLVYVIAMEIHTPQAFNKELKQRNAAVIERLEDIRTAERAFKKKYQYFTGSFDTLINFVLNDTLEMERKFVDEDDSVAMAQLKRAGKKNIEKFNIAVIDTIFSPRKLSREDIENLRYIPFTDNKTQFLLDAEEKGCKILNGLGMSLYQGVAQVELWTGKKGPVEAMRKELMDILEEQKHA